MKHKGNADIGESESNGITQGFYKARGNTGYDIMDYFTYGDEDRGYYSYIVIGGTKYDLGWVSYEGNDTVVCYCKWHLIPMILHIIYYQRAFNTTCGNGR